MFAPWMQRYSVPERFAPRRRSGVVPSKSWLPTACTPVPVAPPELDDPELPELELPEPELDPVSAPELEEELDADPSGPAAGAPELELLELDPDAPPSPDGACVVSPTAAPHAATKAGSATSTPREEKERDETGRNFVIG